MKKKWFLKDYSYLFSCVRKIVKVMRLSIFLVVLTSLQSLAISNFAQSGKINVKVENKTVSEVLQLIERESDFFLFYNNKVVDLDEVVTLDLTNKTVIEVLDILFKDKGVTYTINNKQIVLSRTSGRSNRFDSLQKKSVSGKVTDKNGEPLPGVAVMIKGTTQGTITNADGEYSLNANMSEDDMLVFSFVGMKTQEITLAGKTNINITLEEETVGVDEVIVTAFGINREKKQLSYSIQGIDGDQLSATGNSDLTKGLQGKVAGVTIRQVNGSPGSTPKVTIRGSNSINGGNDPLYVVDGFPVDGSIALDIDPNEIEDISILKGATAAALYGLRASNGVILVSTKRGKNNERNKPTVTLTTNYSFDWLSVYPETQKIYAQGINTFDAYSAYSWGPKISEMGTYTNQLGEQEEARAYDNARDFFNTGGTLNSNISIANNFDRGNYSIGIGYAGQEGIVSNTDLSRVSVKLAGDYQISDKIKVGTLVNYSTYTTNGTTNNGGNSSIFYAAFDTPPSYNLKGKPTHVDGNEYQQINFRGSHDNIYWGVNHNVMKTETSSFIGAINFDYNPTSWLNFNYRAGAEEVAIDGLNVYELGSGVTGGRTNPPSGGKMSNTFNKRRTINSTFLASVKKQVADKLDLDFMVGHEYYDYNYRYLQSVGTDFTIGGFHNLSNCGSITSDQHQNRRRSYAFFSNLNLAYDDMLFLTLTGRNDVVSNMPRANRSFFYPSVGLGFIFTEAMEINPKILSFGKVRMSYAEVGQAGSIYSTVTTYSPGGASYFSFPFNGINAFTLSNSLKSTDLKPENTKSVEFGTTLGFLNNRINLDYTYYYSKSDGQIFSVPISSSSGYTSETRNAGVMLNHGHEMVLTIKPVVTDKFSWDITTNFASFVNKVEKLAEGIETLNMGGSRVSIQARAGELYPTLFGTGYARDPETGKIVVESDPNSARYGMPLSTTGDIKLGKADPDFELSFMNTFKYKNLTLYAQVDWRKGGKIASGNSRLAKLYGTHHDTKFREEDCVLDAMKGHYDSNGNLIVEDQNDIVIQKGYYYYRTVLDPIRESNVYDASFIRLREVKLGYDLPARFLKKLHISNASVYAIGRNLWLIKSGLPYYDPEMSDGSGNAIGETYADYPQTSSFGLGLNLKF